MKENRKMMKKLGRISPGCRFCFPFATAASAPTRGKPDEQKATVRKIVGDRRVILDKQNRFADRLMA